MELKLTPELLAQARAAKSAEELLALAKENGIAMTDEEAAEAFAVLHSAMRELADRELENVSAGMCVGDSSEFEATTYEHQRIIQNGVHTTAVKTCRLCGNTSTMDKYVWVHTQTSGGSSYTLTETIFVCRKCNCVPIHEYSDSGSSGGC